MLNIRLRFLILIFAALIYPAGVFAYGQRTTHPALTQEIVDFYNSLHPGDPLSQKEKEWLMKGSILEDTAPRSLNHLYDPVRDIAWNGEGVGGDVADDVDTFDIWCGVAA